MSGKKFDIQKLHLHIVQVVGKKRCVKEELPDATQLELERRILPKATGNPP
jgi:hypothetical protein